MGSRDRAGGLSVDESKIDERSGLAEARSGNSDRAGDARVASDGAGAEKQSEGTRSAELLMGLVEGARIFRAADGRFHARVAIEGQNELIGLRSVDSDGHAHRVQARGREEGGDIGALAQNAERALKRTEPAGASPSWARHQCQLQQDERITIDQDCDWIAERGRVVSVKTGKFGNTRKSGTNDSE
jgi:hypothetical protein